MQSKYTHISDFSPSQITKFWDRVIVPDDPDACWQWSGRLHARYGMLPLGKRELSIFAHRASYIIHNGYLALDDVIRHACDNPPCTNPRHLLAGTQRDNILDMLERAPNECLRKRKVIAYGEAHWSHQRPEKRVRGSRNGASKLTEEQVGHILQMRAAGASYGDIMRLYPVSKPVVAKICKRQAWTHVPPPGNGSQSF